MLEMNDESSFQVPGESSPRERAGRTETVGRVRLAGELVDINCYFGVMRPARGKVHRACSVRSLFGGAPPVCYFDSPTARQWLCCLRGRREGSRRSITSGRR